MKLTVFLTLLVFSCSYALRFDSSKASNRREFLQALKDENSDESMPTIDFTGDWEENVQGELGVGKDFLIKYDGSRLPGRPTMYGKPSWKIYVEYKFNDGSDFTSEDLGSPTVIDGKEIFQTTISIPLSAEKVVMWFKHWSYYGGNKYDSNHGSNYNFEITAPSIVFDDQWNEIVRGKLSAGNSFDLFYDSKRLKEGVKVIAQMKFVGDNVVTEPLDMIENSSYETAEISISQGAEKLEMWFYYTDENGNKHYDSNYGENYNFSLQ